MLDNIDSFIDRSPFRWLVLAFVVALLTAAAGYNYHAIDVQLTEAALMRRDAVGQLMVETLSEKFGRSIDIALSLSTRVHLRKVIADGKWDKAIAILHDVPEEFPFIERIFLTDTRGTLMADVPALPGVRGSNFADRDWYKGISRNWQPYISGVYTRTAVPRLGVFSVVVPVKDASGKVDGILGLQINIENLLRWLEGIRLEESVAIYLVDPNGQMLFHSRENNRFEVLSIPMTPDVKKLRLEGDSVQIGYDPFAKEQSIIAYASEPNYGWGVAVKQPIRSSKVLAARDSQLRQVLLGYGLILVLGVMMSILTLRISSVRKRAGIEHQKKDDLERLVNERTAELQAVNKELEAFSYSVSHDLRAPLRTIDGFSQALLEDYGDRLDDQAKDYLNRVRGATQHMGELIDDMLTLSRVTRVEMQFGIVNFSEQAANVFAELQQNEPDRKVDCHIEPGLITEGDVHLLRVVLFNLLGNAWKYTGLQPQPRIEFGAIRNADGTLEYFVRDNGAGFDMAYAGKLFGAFQRLHASSEFSGTGVGLATVQRIIYRHGGKVRGEGMPGQGATFYFTLP